MRQAPTLEIVSFVNSHLARRRRANIGSLNTLARSKRADAFVKACGAKVIEGGRYPAYDPLEDIILMPRAMSAWSAMSLFGPGRTIGLLHELIHWSGHRSRLDRASHRTVLDDCYRREELVAELGSALLCFDLGLTASATLPHAKYLNGYLASLPNARVELDLAFGRTGHAVGYLFALYRQAQARAA